MSASPATVWLQINLLTDVIVTRHSASVGVHECLDYLPGSVLLGAVAARLFAEPEFGPEFFLSGRVRFGDGLPDNGAGAPAWPAPLNYHVSKGDHAEDGAIINPLFDAIPEGRQIQQVRDCHLAADGRRLRLGKSYQLKTAIDRGEFGRASERQLFGYEALPAGSVFFAPVTFAAEVEANPRQRTIDTLTGGGIRLGRSRSAQYGGVKIELSPAAAWPSPTEHGLRTDRLVLYLASDLALFSDCAPTLIPTAAHFGLRDGSAFLSAQSYLRTRRYSPWNAFRGARDTERHVLVRGSVLVFSNPTGVVRAELAARLEKDGVGLYTQEGLGRVCVDPGFVLHPVSAGPRPAQPQIHATASGSPTGDPPSGALAQLLVRKAKDRGNAKLVDALAQTWSTEWLDWRRDFADTPFPGRSQWNRLREITLTQDWLREATDFCTGRTDDPTKKTQRSEVWRNPPLDKFGHPIGENLGAFVLRACNSQNEGAVKSAALREAAMRVVRTLEPKGTRKGS